MMDQNRDPNTPGYAYMEIGEVHIISEPLKNKRGFLVDFAWCINEVFKPKKFKQTMTDKVLEIERTE